MSMKLNILNRAPLLVLTLVLLKARLADAHLTIACTSIPQSTPVVYTRAQTGTTEDFYFFTSSYHSFGRCSTGRWNEGLLWLQEHPMSQNNPSCTRSNLANVQVGKKPNGGIITYTNADTSGKYWGKQRYSNCAGSGCSTNNIKVRTASNSGFSYGYTMKRSNYLGRIDINDYREHCTSAASWTSLWYNFPPFRLTALYDDNNVSPAPMGKQKKILMCFRGFGCESRTYKYEYTVQRGCPAGKYEDPNVRWILKRTDKNNPGSGNNGYQDYCITCPAGRYTDPSDIAAKPALSINDCKQCPEGKFGDEENSPNRDGASYCVTCPAGRYGGTKGLSDATCTGLCLPGYYCPAVTATQTELNEKATGGAIGNPPKEVVASRFGNFGALTDQGSGVCPAGYYCPSGSGSETCVSGTTSSSTNQRCKHECLDGANCRVVSDATSTRCFCPSGSAAPSYVQPGYYAAGEGDHKNPVATRDTQLACPATKYCVGGNCGNSLCDGSQHDCPAGRYGSVSGLSSPTCSGECSPGFFCPQGSRWPTEQQCGGIGFYCPAGSGQRLNASANQYTYCPVTSSQGPKCPTTTREAVRECPAGYFCDGGGIVNIFWEDTSLNSYMCRFVSASNPRVATANAKIEEGIADEPVLPLLLTPNQRALHAVFGTGVAANDDGVAANMSQFSIRSVTCATDNTELSNTTYFVLKNLTMQSDGGVGLFSKQALTSTTCVRYIVKVFIGHHEYPAKSNGECDIDIKLLAKNKNPVFNTNFKESLKERAVYEREDRGTIINTYDLGTFNAQKGANDLGLLTEPIATDPDKGQDLAYEIVASNPVGANKTLFGISQCSGELFTRATLNYDDSPGEGDTKGKYYLCIKVCDDPTFFEGETVGLCADNSGINNDTLCGTSGFKTTCTQAGGVCVVVKVVNVNDPPYFNLTAPTSLAIDEQMPANTTVKLGNLHDLVVDPDDPTGKYLTFGLECLSCPVVKITTVFRTSDGKVTANAHGLKTGDVLQVANVLGMPELSLPYQYYTITVTDFNTFLLNVDTRNFAAGTVGTGGSATHMYLTVLSDGILRSTIVFRANLIGSMSIRISVKDQGAFPPVTNFYVVEVIDINDPPSLQYFTISMAEDTVPLQNASSPYSLSPGVTGFIASDPDGIYYRALDPDNTISTEKEKNQFYNDYSLINDTLWVVKNLPNSEQHATLLPLFQLDYETKKSYNVTVVVTDGRGTNGTGIINVAVLDVNEPPQIASLGVSASEGVYPRSHVYCKLNATTGSKTCATNVTNSKIVDFAQYQYYDPEDGYITDSSNLPQGITFGFKDGSSISSLYPPQKCSTNANPCGQYFFIDVLTGNIYVNNPPNYEDPNKNFFRMTIVVTQTDPSTGIVSTSESVLTLNVTDAPEPPEIGSSDTENDPNNFKVNEIIDDSDIARNVTNNDNVTRFLSGTDPEGGSLTWAVKKCEGNETFACGGNTYNPEGTSDTHDVFNVTTSGEIYVVDTAKKKGVLDFEGKQFYKIAVEAKDETGRTTVGYAVVRLYDLNDPPTVQSNTANTATDIDGMAVLGWVSGKELGMISGPVISASDPEGCSVVYAIANVYIPATNSTPIDASDASAMLDINAQSGQISVGSSKDLDEFLNDQGYRTADGQKYNRSETNFTMKVDISVTEDSNSASGAFCSEGKASQVNAAVYVNVAKFSDPMTLVLSLDVNLTETTPIGTRLGRVTESLKRDVIYSIKEIIPNVLYANDGFQYTDTPTQLTNHPTEPFQIDQFGNLTLNSNGIDFENHGKQSTWNGNKPIRIVIQAYNPETKGIKVQEFNITLWDVDEAPYWAQTGINYPITCTINENDANPPFINESNLVAIDIDVGDYYSTSSLNTLNRDLPQDELQFKCSACNYQIVGVKGTRPDGTKVDVASPWPFEEASSATNRFYGNNDFGIAYNNASQLWPLDYEDYSSYEIIIGTGSGNNVTRSLIVTITDQNERPAIVDDRHGHVAENSVDPYIVHSNSSLGRIDLASPFIVNDPDSFTQFTFTILSVQANSKIGGANKSIPNTAFTIFSSGGVIYLKATAPFDFENCTQYDVTLAVDDGGNSNGNPLNDTGRFVVNIDDVNDISEPHFNGITYNLQTSGGAEIKLYGTNFGPTDFKYLLTGKNASVVVKYGPRGGNTAQYTAKNCSVSKRNTEISCLTVPGVGKDLAFTVFIDGSSSPLSSVGLSFIPPAITKVEFEPSTISTTGGDNVTITGTNFGPLGTLVELVSYENNVGDTIVATNCRVIVAFVKVKCSTGPGTGKDLAFKIKFGGQESSSFASNLTYTKPGVTSLTVPSEIGGNSSSDFSVNGAGGQVIEINGNNFGDSGSIVTLNLGPVPEDPLRYVAVACTIVVPHVKAKCVLPAGVGIDHSITISVAGQSNTYLGQLISYKPPKVTGVVGPGAKEAETIGGAIVFIEGEHFGPPTSPHGPELPCAYGATFATISSNIVTGVVSAYNTTREHASLKILYGAWSDMSYIAHCCAVINDRSMQCKTAQGTGKDHAWKVRVGNQMSNIFAANTSYGNPVIREYRQVIAPVDALNTIGNEQVDIFGANFGFLLSDIDSITYGSTGFDYKVNVSDCVFITNHVLLRCRTQPGSGSSHRWFIDINGQRSINPTTAYARPEVHGISFDKPLNSSNSEDDKLSTFGGTVVNISGANFGPIGTDAANIRVTYGPGGRYYVARDCKVVVASTLIQCKTVPGIGKDHTWTVEVDLQLSPPCVTAACKTSYKQAVIEEIVPAEGTTEGPTTVILKGKNFGSVDYIRSQPNVPTLLFEGAPHGVAARVEKIYQDGDVEEVTCDIGPGFGTGKTIELRVRAGSGEVVTSNVMSFNYANPAVHTLQLTSSNSAPQGQKKLSIKGENFCAFRTCAILYMCACLDYTGPGGTPGCCTSNATAITNRQEISPTLLHSHTKIEAYTALEQGTVIISVGASGTPYNLRQNSVAKVFKHVSPIIVTPSILTGMSPELYLDGTLSGLKYSNNDLSHNDKDNDGNTVDIPTRAGNTLYPYKVDDVKKEDLNAEVFSPHGSDEIVELLVQDLGDDPSAVCITVGTCVPKPRCINISQYGELCNKNDLSGGRIVSLYMNNNKGGFESVESKQNSGVTFKRLKFRMPAGVGKDNELRVWRDEQPSYNDENPVMIDYKQPELSSLKTTTDSPLVKVKGKGMTIKIAGKHFGGASHENKVIDGVGGGAKLKQIASLTFGGIDLLSSQFNVEWKCTLVGAHCSENFEIQVDLPKGQGGPHELSLEVGGQKLVSSSMWLDYEEPKVTTVVPSRVSTQGGDKIIIKGENLGCASSDPFKLCAGGHEVDFLDPGVSLVVPCPISSSDVSVDEVNCTVGEGQGKDLSVRFSINKFKNSNGTTTTNEEKVLSFFIPSIDETDASQGIFIEGEGKVGSGAIEGTTDGKDPATGKKKKLTIVGENFGLPNSSDVAIKFICCKENFNSPDCTGQSQTPSRYCVDGQVIKLDRNTPNWKNNHTAIEALMPEGVGKDLVIKICAGGQCYTLPQKFSFSAPKITSLSPRVGLTDGCKDGAWEPLSNWHARTDGATARQISRNPELQRICNEWTKITIGGENFGPFPESLKVTIGQCSDYTSEDVCESLVGKDKCKWENSLCKPITAGSDDSAFTLFDGSIFPLQQSARRLQASYDKTENNVNIRLKQALFDLHDYLDGRQGRRLARVVCSENLQTRNEKCMCGSDIKVGHKELTICAPVGFGTNLTLKVLVADRPSEGDLKWSFDKPKITSALPRPYDAMGGERLILRGINLGPVETETKVKLGQMQCTLPKWKDYHESDGRPYIECLPVEDVVGSKNLSLSVALQDADKIVGLENAENSVVSSRCRAGDPDPVTGKSPNYYADADELCSPCPIGAICKGGSFEDPIAQTSFWRDQLDITESIGDFVADTMGDKAEADYEKAAGLRSVVGEEGQRTIPRRCGEKRLFTDEVRSKFPHAFQRDRCYDFIPCMPKLSCLGGNKCEVGYQHQKNFCQKKVDEGKVAQQMKCSVSLQCRTRSAGPACTKAIEDVCKCPKEWEWRKRSFSCLKECLRDARKMSILETKCQKLIGRSDSVKENMFKVIARGECTSRNPEDCAQCIEVKNATGGGSVGVCECVSAKRCAFCSATTHYKIDGKCEECPANPELVIIGFILGIICVCAFMRWLDKRRFNLAFINIGWDYFQVLAMFTDCDVDWPAALKSLYRMLSFFSFDIDIVAPECLVPDFPYETKFWMVVLSPIILGFFLVICWACYMCFNSFFMQRARDKLAHARFTAVFLLSWYYLYISVTRRALEIFNCNPLDPDDGLLYTSFTSFECDSGPCECGNPRHVQVRLVTPAIFAIVYMTVGFPIVILFLLRKKKTLIKEDQLLRAHDTGDSIFTNPRSFYLRTWLHKMYFYFKPGKTYWIIVIILRKMLICVAALMFRANPGFQLAFVLLVLFICYVVQVKHQPYMSTVQRMEALAEHHKKAYDELDPEHIRIEESIKAAFAYVQRKSEISGRRHKVSDVEFSDSGNLIHRVGIGKHKQKYFWDYNTVEQILLACAILVCLSGIMFESDRFKNDKFGKFSWQRELITWCILFVVIFSIIYYTIVLVSEIYGKVPKIIEKLFAKRKKGTEPNPLKYIDSMDEVEFSTNPVFLNDGKDLEKLKQQQAKEMENSELTTEALMERNAILQQRLRAAQQNQARQTAQGSDGVEMVPQRKRNKKKGFDFSNAGGEVAVVDGKVVKGEVEEEEIV